MCELFLLFQGFHSWLAIMIRPKTTWTMKQLLKHDAFLQRDNIGKMLNPPNPAMLEKLETKSTFLP